MDEKDLRSLVIRRIVLTVLCVVLGVVLTVMIGATVYAKHLLGRLNYVSPDPTVPAVQEIAAMETQTQPPLQGFTEPKIEIADQDFGTGPQIPVGGGEIVNILLIGQDRSGDTGARSDCMILCTFNKEENTITMTSFLRDLYVTIPGYRKNRINAAYTFGGMELLDETLQENFGVEIDGNVQVDFSHFKEIIDLLGGVNLELTAAEAKFIKRYYPNSAVTEGMNRLSGAEALMYARNRHDVDGDFSRTGRQRKLLNALIDAYKNQKLTQMLAVLSDVLPMITTDIPKSDLTAYAVTLFPMLADAEIRTQAIPAAGAYRNATIDKMAVLVPDLEKNRQLLEETLK